MRKVILYIASSLDGFIARDNHELDWLFDDDDYGYFKFYDKIDTTLMGNETYRLVKTFGDFPYKDKENFVFTRNPHLKDEKYVHYVSENVAGFVKELKKRQGKDIWLVGGGQINSLLLKEKLIDEMIISLHPVILGKGKALFPGLKETYDLKMNCYRKFKSGLVQITYNI